MGNCKLGGKHWQRLWNNHAVRAALIEESERIEAARLSPILQGLTDLYMLENYSFTALLHNPLIGGLKGDESVYSEIQRHLANPRLTREEQIAEDEANAEAVLAHLNSLKKS